MNPPPYNPADDEWDAIEAAGYDSYPMIEHHYRGETIQLNRAVPVGRRGRYVWSGHRFAQLNHAKTAINDHYRQHTAGSTRS